MEIGKEQLATVPYLNKSVITNTSGRVFVLKPFYINSEWKIPVPAGNKLLLITGIPAASTYVSQSIVELENDIFIPCIDFLYRYFTWDEINYFIDGLLNSFENLFIIVNKIDSFLKIRDNKLVKNDFIRTEMEYLFIVCKSIYDTLQKIISIFWNKKVKLLGNIEKRNLPDKYRNVIINNGKKRTLDEMITKYNIPLQLAEYYYKQFDFYEKLRIIRNDIVHHEKTLDYFFVFDEGFAISKDTKLFKEYNIWNEDDKKENNIYSIRPLISYIINNTIKSCDDYCKCILQVVKLPEQMILDNVYLRTPHIKAFKQMERDLKTTSWWK